MRLVCISPGSRSTPLVWGLTKLRHFQPDLQLVVHLDERSASFFGLGYAKRNGVPVVLICTSGTAPAHYFPAIIEANLSLIPLIILTADRPPYLRHRGSPQTSDQIKLYGDQVRYFNDVGLPDPSPTGINGLRNTIRQAIACSVGVLGSPKGAVHLNFPFAEPLVDQPNLEYPFFQSVTPSLLQLTSPQSQVKPELMLAISEKVTQIVEGIIILGIGNFPDNLLDAVLSFSDRAGYPVLGEAISLPRSKVISHYDSFLRSVQFCSAHVPKLVLRFGGMPTSKYLCQWLAQHLNHWQEIVISNSFTNPLNGNSQILACDPLWFTKELNQLIPPRTMHSPWRESFLLANRFSTDITNNFLSQVTFPFEGIIYQKLAEYLPENACLYVANSMPTRDLDTFFRSHKPIKILANKGCNGIDGTIACALGAAYQQEKPTVLVCGDIAFYHDLNSLLTAHKYQINLTIILLNNDGGGIFQYLPIANYDPPFHEFFLTAHGLEFHKLVPAFNCQYQLVTTVEQLERELCLIPAQIGTKVLEIYIDPQRSYHLHQQLWQRVRTGIEQLFRNGE